MEEFKVGISNQTADFNGAAGGLIQMVTKRGGNTARFYDYYYSTDVGAANSWKNDHTASGSFRTPLPKTHSNRYGGALGGPMLPKFLGGKTYFFTNYEGYRFPNTVEKTVPTAHARRRCAGSECSRSLSGLQPEPYPLPWAEPLYQPAVCSTGA